MRIITSLLLGVFVVLAMAIPAEAQWGRRYDPTTDMIIGAVTGTDGYRGGYRGYDPYYNMYNDPRRMDPCFKAQQYYEGIRGGFHFHKVDGGTEKHFWACDPTKNPIETREAGAYGGLAGTGIGAVLGGKNGAMIGAAIGAGGSGYLASRKGHDDCLVVDFTPKGGKVQVQPAVQQNEAPASYQEQEALRPTPAVLEKKIVRNRFDNAPIRVYIGSEKILDLPAGTDDAKIEVPANSKIWGEAYLENTKNMKREWVPLQPGKGIDNLPENSGWVFGNPETRPSL